MTPWHPSEAALCYWSTIIYCRKGKEGLSLKRPLQPQVVGSQTRQGSLLSTSRFHTGLADCGRSHTLKQQQQLI